MSPEESKIHRTMEMLTVVKDAKRAKDRELMKKRQEKRAKVFFFDDD
jgi:hypothetical protein